MKRLNPFKTLRLRQPNQGARLNNPKRRPECKDCDQYRKGFDAGFLAGRREPRR